MSKKTGMLNYRGYYAIISEDRRGCLLMDKDDFYRGILIHDIKDWLGSDFPIVCTGSGYNEILKVDHFWWLEVRGDDESHTLTLLRELVDGLEEVRPYLDENFNFTNQRIKEAA